MKDIYMENFTLKTKIFLFHKKLKKKKPKTKTTAFLLMHL